jgi:TfoX/Sxy family transcriptional regulator of competence genes
MAYDEELAERVRELIAPLASFEERKMFGGLAFMVNTHMSCGIVKDDLMVRVGKAGYDAALARGARELAFTGRPMRGMVIVPGPDVSDEATLEPWVSLAVEFAQSEPAKPPKAPRVTKEA